MTAPRLETTCPRPAEPAHSTSQPLGPSLDLSVVYTLKSLDQVDAIYNKAETGYIYARDGHPNATQLAGKIAQIEGAEAGLVCASGMAAEAALFLTGLSQGDEIALSDGLYGRTIVMCRELGRFGVTSSTFDATKPETLKAVLNPRTKMVFAETLSNPLVRLADIPALAEIAHGANATFIIDHTFAPILCQPVRLGADALTHSATKLIGGHSDLTLGLVAGSKAILERATPVASTFGLTGNPFESWLCLRGIATLSLRSARACSNALSLAEKLSGHPSVKAVHYAGLTSHPDHERARTTLSGGFGTIVTIDLGGRPQADAFIQAVEHIPFAPSLGDVATTLSHPATTSHRGQSPEQWAKQGISPGLVRLSIGIEAVEDLWEQIRAGLAAVS